MGVNAPVLFDFHVVYAAELKLRAAAQIVFHIAALPVPIPQVGERKSDGEIV